MSTRTNDYPHGDTSAARLLAGALRQKHAEGISLRALGRELGYKQAVVLSHMATGRVPIPIDRVSRLAAALGIDERAFLIAVLQQRFPDIDWETWIDGDGSSVQFGGILAGVRLDQLSDDQRSVAGELVRDTHPKERWLSIPEIALVSAIRSARPTVGSAGLSATDLDRVHEALSR